MGLAAAAAVAAVASVAGVGYGIHSGERAASAQKEAQKQAIRQSEAQAKAADQAENRANRKRPNGATFLSEMSQAGKTGGSSTMLTGPQGIDPSSLKLGKTTLLGM